MTSLNSMKLIPKDFICPLTLDIMINPVTDIQGISYEKSALVDWINTQINQFGQAVSPITKQTLTIDDLRPNLALKNQIETFCNENPLSVELFKTQGLTSEDTNVKLPAVANHNNNFIFDQNQYQNFVLQSKSFYNDKYTAIVMSSPNEPSRMPVHICCVVDISGSMGSNITIVNESNDTVSDGLSRLDIVKHAINTILHSLRDGDVLSLVTFSDDSKIVLNPLLINDTTRSLADVVIKSLCPTSGTYLWSGLETGLDVLRSTKNNYKVNSLFLLTDGVPTKDPIVGYQKELENYQKKNGQIDCTIHTFGFGYDLRSDVLQTISNFGHGLYSFIPDASFVGTIFINALTNLFLTVATHLNCEVQYSNGSSIMKSFNAVQFGQDRIAIIQNVSTDVYPVNLIVNYYDIITSSMKTITHTDIQYSNDMNELAEIHNVRQNFISTLQKSMLIKNVSPVVKFVESVVDMIDNKYIKAIIDDATGEVYNAFSQLTNYERWGKHYLPSLMGAHDNQVCNNFKDHGVQNYTSPIFELIRTEINNIFDTLPNPTPSNVQPKYQHKTINMSRYNNQSGGCVGMNCMVKINVNNTIKYLRAGSIKVGDQIVQKDNSLATVTHVVKSMCNKKNIDVIKIQNPNNSNDEHKLVITPWHPIIVNDEWKFPNDCGTIEQYITNYVCNFVLDKGHMMEVEGTWCVTMGHNFTDNDVVKHEYYGSHKVVDDLNIMIKNDKNEIIINNDQIVRDPITNKVKSIMIKSKK